MQVDIWTWNIVKQAKVNIMNIPETICGVPTLYVGVAAAAIAIIYFMKR